MRPDKYTLISAGFGALLAAKGAPAWTALLFTAGAEAVSQTAERVLPGSTGLSGPNDFEKSVTDVGAAFLAWWIVSALK